MGAFIIAVTAQGYSVFLEWERLQVRNLLLVGFFCLGIFANLLNIYLEQELLRYIYGILRIFVNCLVTGGFSVQMPKKLI
jgi:hypothetical protein